MKYYATCPVGKKVYYAVWKDYCEPPVPENVDDERFDSVKSYPVDILQEFESEFRKRAWRK